jgi:hypothetical protein
VTADKVQGIFEELAASLRAQGIICAITSGLACVHYGIAETTKDCDLLCHPQGFTVLLQTINAFQIDGVACGYRGNLSPPLDGRWHAGGWTSHFEWPFKPDPFLLYVFGQALRQFSPWEGDLSGLYAGANTVAAMKRTSRDKDWPFVTSLGLRMVEAGDERGWLHIFNPDVLKRLLQQEACPDQIAAQRPALRLAQKNDPQLAGALNAERKLWEELDRRRIHIMEHALRPYVSAVRAERSRHTLTLLADHELRVRCALEHLPPAPLRDYGIDRIIDESRRGLVDSGLIPETGLDWLPDVRRYFQDA